MWPMEVRWSINDVARNEVTQVKKKSKCDQVAIRSQRISDVARSEVTEVRKSRNVNRWPLEVRELVMWPEMKSEKVEMWPSGHW